MFTCMERSWVVVTGLLKGRSSSMATPQQFLDHMQNTPGFMYKSCQCLVIDEAYRILDVRFEELLGKLLKFCHHANKLFSSGTQTPKVEDLSIIFLKNWPLYMLIWMTINTMLLRMGFSPLCVPLRRGFFCSSLSLKRTRRRKFSFPCVHLWSTTMSYETTLTWLS